ncbi:MAG: hypothetical protein EKK47_20555 [Burkholderiales bacterium]|jgi:hypothetical protein|nr:MAG: hypothetical protein EKK47_20555 [Burkholderiales bacterium]
MSPRLQAEWQRLYVSPSSPAFQTWADDASLTGPEGRTRAMVLSVGRPADWASLSAVWQAVQSELGWPAPAIAVSGVDSYQLWFSLVVPMPVQDLEACLAALCQRHLGHLVNLGEGRFERRFDLNAGALPSREVRPGQWSAFLAPDLAPMFADTPWLDISPNPQGQAELLSQIQSIQPEQWQSALAQLRSSPSTKDASPINEVSAPATAPGEQDPRRFLLRVMNDESVDLALRIEAAKALLPFSAPR